MSPRHAATARGQARLCIPAALCILALLLAGAAQANTYQVGPTRTYQTFASLPNLLPGDIVEVDPGTYNEVKRWTASGTAANPILIRGVGATQPIVDATGKNVSGSGSNPRAVFQFDGDYFTVENLQFTNAGNVNGNGAGIRVNGGDHITVRNCTLVHNDMGLMSSNNSALRLEGCEIAYNGFDVYSHNVYVEGDSVTAIGCYIHDATSGLNFKSRAHFTELFYNTIAYSQDGEVDLVDGVDTAAANSNAVMIGNVVVSKVRQSGYNHTRFINFGEDGGRAHNGTLAAFNNTFVTQDSRIDFLICDVAEGSILAKNNIFYGSDTIVGAQTGGGIAGSDNWLAATADVPGSFTNSVQSAGPGFVDLLGGDYHLTALSACIDQGTDALVYDDGDGVAHSGVPTLEYVNHLATAARLWDGSLDIGAYEVPEPATFSLLAAGALAAVWRRKSRRRLPGTRRTSRNVV